MSIELHPSLKFVTLDEFAETFDGVSKQLYRRLWSLIPAELPKPVGVDEPVYGEWPEPDHPNRALLSRHWHQLTDAEQTEINAIAATEDEYAMKPIARFYSRSAQISIDGISVDARNATPEQWRTFADNARRADLIAFCTWNDPNGCVTDEQMRLEYDRVATDAELRTLITQWSSEL